MSNGVTGLGDLANVLNDIGLGEDSNKIFKKMKVGVVGDSASAKHPKSNESVGFIALIHELGLGVPERSFLRGWIDANETLLRQKLTTAAGNAIVSPDQEKALEEELTRVAEWMVGQIQAGIIDGIPPGLAPSTIKGGRHNPPLIDTGTLLRALNYELDNG